MSNGHVLRYAHYVEDPSHSLEIDLSQPQNNMQLPPTDTDQSNFYTTHYKDLADHNLDLAFFALRLPHGTSNVPFGLGLDNIDPNWVPTEGESCLTLGYPVIGGNYTTFPNIYTYKYSGPHTDPSTQITDTEFIFEGISAGGASGSGIVNGEGKLVAFHNKSSEYDANTIGQDLPSNFFADFTKFQELAKQSMQPMP